MIVMEQSRKSAAFAHDVIDRLLSQTTDTSFCEHLRAGGYLHLLSGGAARKNDDR
jgi:hypothetical protein